jgi:hypothetical protein
MCAKRDGRFGERANQPHDWKTHRDFGSLQTNASVFARKEGALKLANYFIEHTLDPGERLNIVSHSHGGNLVKEFTNLPGVPKIDTVVNLATPQREEHIINLNQVGNYFNVYSIYDGVQDNLGGYDWDTILLMTAGAVPQRSHWATNIELNEIVVDGKTKRVGHSGYYSVPAWRWVEFYMNQLGPSVTVTLKF